MVSLLSYLVIRLKTVYTLCDISVGMFELHRVCRLFLGEGREGIVSGMGISFQTKSGMEINFEINGNGN